MFDLEATCWKTSKLHRRQEIIEIGAVKSDIYANALDTFQSFARPVEYPQLSYYCMELTGIGQADVDRAPAIEEVLEEFLYWSGREEEEVVFCSWGAKDRDLLAEACGIIGMADDWLDNYVDLKPQFAEVRRLNRTVGLKRALKMTGEDFEGSHHRALDDAKNLFIIFRQNLDSWIY